MVEFRGGKGRAIINIDIFQGRRYHNDTHSFTINYFPTGGFDLTSVKSTTTMLSRYIVWLKYQMATPSIENPSHHSRLSSPLLPIVTRLCPSSPFFYSFLCDKPLAVLLLSSPKLNTPCRLRCNGANFCGRSENRSNPLLLAGFRVDRLVAAGKGVACGLVGCVPGVCSEWRWGWMVFWTLLRLWNVDVYVESNVDASSMKSH